VTKKSERRTSRGRIPLAVSHPRLAKEAFGWDPWEVSGGSGYKLDWKCPKGHVYPATVGARANLNSKCPVCTGQRVLAGFNDLKTTHPNIARQAYGWDPKTVSAGSSARNRKWICGRKHYWLASCYSRTHLKSGCPYCANQMVWTGFNDVMTKNPKLGREAHGWNPSKKLYGGHQKVSWKCVSGHIYQQSVSARKLGIGCSTCASKTIKKGFNDFQSRYPEIAKQAHGWDPSKVSWGSSKKQLWKCKRQHIYPAAPKSRGTKGSGCPFCENLQVLIGYNDLKTIAPNLAREAYGWDPTKVVAKSNKRLKWICSEGHIYENSPNGRSTSGCARCAEYGFNPSKPSYFYFLMHEKRRMLQIGITNSLDSRLPKHTRRGWIVLALRGPYPGYVVRRVESECLQYLHDIQVKMAGANKSDKFDGYTEAWGYDDFPVGTLGELFAEVYGD